MTTISKTTTTVVDETNTVLTIPVIGVGTVKVPPDRMSISVTIESTKLSVKDAFDETSKYMTDIFAALKTNKVSDNNIKTTNFNIAVASHWDGPTNKLIIDGYTVTNEILVSIPFTESDKGSLGAIIDAVVSSGGNCVRISGISFEVADPSQHILQARRLAFDNAKEKASDLVSHMGRVLGDVAYIDDAKSVPNEQPRSPRMMAMVSSAPTAPVSSGNYEITETLNITFYVLHKVEKS
jgi:uncharacterized protein YggE